MSLVKRFVNSLLASMGYSPSASAESDEPIDLKLRELSLERLDLIEVLQRYSSEKWVADSLTSFTLKATFVRILSWKTSDVLEAQRLQEIAEEKLKRLSAGYQWYISYIKGIDAGLSGEQLDETILELHASHLKGVELARKVSQGL